MNRLKEVIELVVKPVLRVQKLDLLAVLFDLLLELVDRLRKLLYLQLCKVIPAAELLLLPLNVCVLCL